MAGGIMDGVKAGLALLSGSRMRGRDTVRGQMGNVILLVNGAVHNLGNTTKFEPKNKINTEKIAVLGKVEKDPVASSTEGEFTLEYYANSSVFQEIHQIFQDTGVWPDIRLIVTVNDPRSSAGANVTSYEDVVFDEVSLPALDVETVAMTGSVSGAYGHTTLLNPNKPIPGVW